MAGVIDTCRYKVGYIKCVHIMLYAPGISVLQSKFLFRWFKHDSLIGIQCNLCLYLNLCYNLLSLLAISQWVMNTVLTIVLIKTPVIH